MSTPDRDHFCVPPVAANMAGSIAGLPFDVRGLSTITCEIDWTGTPVGVITIGRSNLYNPTSNPSATFKDITFSPSLAAPAGSAGGMMLDIPSEGAEWLTGTYTRTSGTGMLTIKFHGKAG